MNHQIIKSLYKKEMTDILRDKKTILMMIVVPLILYPLLFIGTMGIMTSIMTSDTREVFMIALYELPNENEIKQFIDEKQSEYDYNFVFYWNENQYSIEDMLKKDKVNAVLSMDLENDDNVEDYIITYSSSDNASATAAGMLENMLKEYREELRIKHIENLDVDIDYYLYPVKYNRDDISTSEETVGSMFGYIIPFLLVTSILMGAMYPAIDATAGEKERGTLETLLTLPVKNIELITSKFLATATVAIAAAFLNVLSMGILGGYFYSSMQASGNIQTEFDIAVYVPSVLLTLLCAIVLALFASAICLCVCIFAKSFKEAQNYTTPVMLVFMFGAMACMLPNIKLANGIELIPIVNIVILISNLFKFEFVWSNIAIVLVSNMAYSILAIIIMTRMFNSEDILFGESSSGIHLLEKRSQMKEKQIPGLGDVFLLFALLLIVVLFAGSLLVVHFGIWGLVGEQLLILLCTVGYCVYIKVDIKDLFHFKCPKLLQCLAAILCWMGAFVLMMLLSAVLTLVFPESAASADNTMVELWENVPFWGILISSAVLPAFCEEMAFRGFLFGTLSKRYHIVPAILWTGIVFGAYHMNIVKLVVVGLLGGLMAYLVYKTESIWISMIVHLLNNSFAVVMTEKEDIMGKLFPVLYSSMTVDQIIKFLLIGIVDLIIGILIIKWCAGDLKRNKA